MQPIEYDEYNVIRFKRNKIVDYMLEAGRAAGAFDLNSIASMNFPKEDYEQLAQLIGYSVSGFGELSYASEETIAIADEIARKLYNERKEL